MQPNATGAGEEFRDDLRLAPTRLLPAEVLGGLTRLSDARSWLAVTQTLGLLAALLICALHWWTPWVVVPAVFLIATQQHAMFVLSHDAAHYRLFSSRTLNDAVGRILASCAGLSMCTYRVVHRLHHNHLYGKQDPDIALHGGYPRGKGYLLKKLATDLCGLTAWKTYSYFFGAPAANAATNVAQRPLDDTSPALRRAAVRDRNAVVGVQIAAPLIILAAFGWSGLLKYLVLWVLPALTVLQAILRLRAIFEHGAPAGYDTPLGAARTNLAGPLLRLALFPHHVNYHIEHHLFPAVPHYRLPQLHAELAARGVLRAAEVRRPVQTWRRVFAAADSTRAPEAA
jgi:fatty acid desaturase